MLSEFLLFGKGSAFNPPQVSKHKPTNSRKLFSAGTSSKARVDSDCHNFVILFATVIVTSVKHPRGSAEMNDECTAELQTESLQGAMGCTSDGLKELARRFPQTYDSNMTNEMQRLHECASGFTIYPMEQKIGKYKALATATRNSNCPDLNLTCDKPFHVFPNACSGAALLEQNPRVFYAA